MLNAVCTLAGDLPLKMASVSFALLGHTMIKSTPRSVMIAMREVGHNLEPLRQLLCPKDACNAPATGWLLNPVLQNVKNALQMRMPGKSSLIVFVTPHLRGDQGFTWTELLSLWGWLMVKIRRAKSALAGQNVVKIESLQTCAPSSVPITVLIVALLCS
jgi:hypothetical protein